MHLMGIKISHESCMPHYRLTTRISCQFEKEESYTRGKSSKKSNVNVKVKLNKVRLDTFVVLCLDVVCCIIEFNSMKMSLTWLELSRIKDERYTQGLSGCRCKFWSLCFFLYTNFYSFRLLLCSSRSHWTLVMADGLRRIKIQQKNAVLHKIS